MSRQDNYQPVGVAPGPWSMEQARTACNMSAASQKGAEQQLREAAEALGAADTAYRVALNKEMVKLRGAGNAATTCETLARGTEHVAALKEAVIAAEGVRDAAHHACYRFGADRREVEQFVDWSMRRELAEHGQPDERVAWTGQRAA